MSQIYRSTSAGPSPPDVPTTFQTDDGPATPAANIINFLTDDTIENFDNGITNTGSGNTVTHYLTNRTTRTVQTVGDTPTEIFRESFGASPSIGLVWGTILAFNITVPPGTGATFQYAGAFRVVSGASVVELGNDFFNEFSDAGMETCDVNVTVDGNDLVIEVTGVGGQTIEWSLLLEYRKL